MTLPPWAYRQRQELSPIHLEGTIESVRCNHQQCLVTLRVASVRRNNSAIAIHVGDLIEIHAMAQAPASQGSPGSPPPTAIGAPQQGVKIPLIGQRTSAWLRPSPQHVGQFDLMAGPYGFGPELAPDIRP